MLLHVGGIYEEVKGLASEHCFYVGITMGDVEPFGLTLCALGFDVAHANHFNERGFCELRVTLMGKAVPSRNFSRQPSAIHRIRRLQDLLAPLEKAVT